MASVRVEADLADLYAIIGSLSIGAEPSEVADDARQQQLVALGMQLVELLLMRRRDRALATQITETRAPLLAGSSLQVASVESGVVTPFQERIEDPH